MDQELTMELKHGPQTSIWTIDSNVGPVYRTPKLGLAVSRTLGLTLTWLFVMDLDLDMDL